MAYFAYKTQLKNVVKDPNSDNLYTAQCMGDSIIVGADAVESQWVLYFPQDGEIKRKFGDQFGVFKKNIDGTPQGGYIEDNGHIRALRLRGLKSEGLAIRLDKVEAAYGKIKEDKLSSIGDEIICCKYIPKRADGSLSTPQQGNKLPRYEHFTQHIDTEQYRYNRHKFTEEQPVQITLKYHGCFTFNAKVKTPSGTKQISKLKVGEEVLGLNLETGKIETTKILQTFQNAKSNHWRKLKFSRNHLQGDKRGYTICTPNHPFWSADKQKYIEAKDLQVGETIHSLFPSMVLTELQKEAMIGLMLGDGCLMSFGNSTAEIQSSSKKEHEEYQNYLIKLLSSFYYKSAQEYTSGYGTTMVRGRTIRTADLYNYLNDCSTFNNQAEVKLKAGIVDKFTPLSAAIFYMDDGSLSHTEYQQDRCNIAICDYQDEDANIIVKCFEKFDIFPTLYRDSGGYNRLRFNLDEANKLWDLIQEYIPPIMQYKLPEPRRNKYYKEIIPVEQHYQWYVMSPQTVLENIEEDHWHVEYDLETELHNYVVGLQVVHNTSQRTAVLSKPKTWYFPILKLFKKDKLFACGSRRVTLSAGAVDNYYKDTFRKLHHEKVCNAIKKYYPDALHEHKIIVFYEIVGFTDSGAPIMPIGSSAGLDKRAKKKYGDSFYFSYGCSNSDIHEPLSNLFVYRITIDDIDLPPRDIAHFCGETGLHYVREYFRSARADESTWLNADEIDYIIEGIFNGEDSKDYPEHPIEGVVIRRLTHEDRFDVYKEKSMEFKIVEGLIKSTATEADIEEAQE